MRFLVLWKSRKKPIFSPKQPNFQKSLGVLWFSVNWFGFIGLHWFLLGHFLNSVYRMTKGFSFTWFALTHYSKKAFVWPILPLYKKYKQLWIASCLHWQNYHLEAASVSQRIPWGKKKKKTECLQLTWPLLLLWSLVQRPMIQPTPQSLRCGWGGPGHLLAGHPGHGWLLAEHVTSSLREGKVFCSLICFLPGWMPGVPCVRNPFYETDGNWAIANKSYSTSFSDVFL